MGHILYTFRTGQEQDKEFWDCPGHSGTLGNYICGITTTFQYVEIDYILLNSIKFTDPPSWPGNEAMCDHNHNPVYSLVPRPSPKSRKVWCSELHFLSDGVDIIIGCLQLIAYVICVLPSDSRSQIRKWPHPM